MNWHISRIRLAQGASAQALAPLILPPSEDGRVSATHHWLWTLFADDPDRKRDFLWREEIGPMRGRATFIVLSAREPHDHHRLFEIETKPFEPALAIGDRLRFRLRANPVVSQPKPGGLRGKRVDPVAAALKSLSAKERAKQRDEVVQAVGRRWLEGQGSRSGFALGENLRVDGDEWRVLVRPAAGAITYSVLDFEGELTIEEPDIFLQKLRRGFGKAKAFGCGLMLIKRT